MDAWEFMQAHRKLSKLPKICTECGQEGARGMESMCWECKRDRIKRYDPPASPEEFPKRRKADDR